MKYLTKIKIEKLHLEKLVWLNLSIIYAKIAPTGLSSDLGVNNYTDKQRLIILNTILYLY